MLVGPRTVLCRCRSFAGRPVLLPVSGQRPATVRALMSSSATRDSRAMEAGPSIDNVPPLATAMAATPTSPTTSPSTAAAAVTGNGNGGGAADEQHPWHERFDVVEDRVIHKRYMTVYDRGVKFTSDSGESHTLQYDVVGHPQCNFSFSIAFPFHPATASTPAQVTLVREYAQGPNALQYCLPTGGFDPRKHSTLRDCAVAEMREEAMLVGGEVVALLPDDHPGQSELKWSRNAFKPYLFIDPQPDPSGHDARDAEEHTIEVLRVSVPELRRIMMGGEMMLPSVYACFLSLEVLAARKLI